MSLEKILEKGELLDFYGKLLTQRQRECLEMYYNKNITQAEIADLAGDAWKRRKAVLALEALLPGEVKEKAAPFLKVLTD